MNLLTKIIKETEEEFDKNVDGNFQGREELDSEEIKRFLRDSQLRLISAFKEMVLDSKNEWLIKDNKMFVSQKDILSSLSKVEDNQLIN